MAKSVIFLVHGMGNFEKGWSGAEDGPVATLSKAAEYYATFSTEQPLDGAVKFVEITYNDIFDGIRERWDDLADSLTDDVPGAAADKIEKIRKAIDSATGDSFVATHLLDVGLYYSFTIIQRLVQLKVASTMMKTIAEHAAESSERRRYIVVAHSLGTTIAHDAIQRMATTGWLKEADVALDILNDQNVGNFVTLAEIQAALDTHGTNPFAPGKFRFEAIFQIANTSRLLHRTQASPYNSVVRPMYAGGSLASSTGRYYNIDHMLDPIGKLQRHRAREAWPNAALNYTADDLFDIKHLHDVNVHGFSHYLLHPLVHANILHAAAPLRFTATDLQTALERLEDDGDFPLIGPKYTDEDLSDRIRDELIALIPQAAGSIPDEYLEKARSSTASLTLPQKVVQWGSMLLALEKTSERVREEVQS